MALMSQNYVLAITIHYWWGPLGTILGPFGPICAHLEVPELDIEAIWMEIVFEKSVTTSSSTQTKSFIAARYISHTQRNSICLPPASNQI